MGQSYGSEVFSGWRQRSASWASYVDHEFVRGLGNGQLPKDAFLAYLIQDYIFLLHFARAWAFAVVKSETADQMRTAAATVNALINEEIQLHVSICQDQGISEEDLLGAKEAPENMAYTRYVMDAGINGDLLDLLSTLAPCVFGYGEIGLRLNDQPDTLPEYRQWIDTYASGEYQDVCRTVALLIEKTAINRLGPAFTENPRWSDLCRRFDVATRLEVDFWQMGLRLGRGE